MMSHGALGNHALFVYPSTERLYLGVRKGGRYRPCADHARGVLSSIRVGRSGKLNRKDLISRKSATFWADLKATRKKGAMNIRRRRNGDAMEAHGQIQGTEAGEGTAAEDVAAAANDQEFIEPLFFSAR